ncbi:MAG TPA: BON domain-containing protein [Acidimicrobiales bacterium]|nr:BON domain-containing protein [Acidimicrobiales bacterium]
MRGTLKRAASGLAVGSGALLLKPGSPVNRAGCHGLQYTARHLRYAAGRLDGLSYRLAGRHPDPNVTDDILADRIRSELGGLEKRLDLPHVHVMVEKHVALLHGDVPSAEDAEAVERAVSQVAGVRGVKSHLHVGLIDGDTRPSEGHRA